MDYSLGTWIKHRRKVLDLTQQELAELVGCSSSLIFKIEADERRPSRQIAKLLAENLDIPADQHTLFLKIARQDKGVAHLESVLSTPVHHHSISTKYSSDNLPVPPTSLIGREHEIDVITRQLLDPDCRLLTLTGPGGIGKTRLAIEAGHQLKSRFADGIYFISLAGVGMTESIIPAIADVLGIAFSGPAEAIVQIITFLQKKEALIVVDNMEHLLEGGSILGNILQQTQSVKMLVTSREQLRLQSEWLFEVQGLPIPMTSSSLENNSAVSLFIQRARQVMQDYSLEADDEEALVRICRMVGGLPLAIELAASWVRILSCREIAQELEASLDFLETKKIDVPLRHRSIRTVFDHSWTLLTPEEQAILKRLSIFQGGFTRESATSVAGASLLNLSSFIDKSLLRYSKGTDRYDMHELVRQYTFSQFISDPIEEKEATEKHALYYASWIADLESSFKSAQQSQISQLIRSETANWLTGWHWAVENKRLDIFRKMSPCLNWYFEVHGNYDEALSIFKTTLDEFRALGAPDTLESPEERSIFASIVDQVGWFEFRKGNVEAGEILLIESLEIAREYNDPEILYYIYGNLGYLSLTKGDIQEAERYTRESLSYAQMLNSPWHKAIPLSVLGIVAYQQGKFDDAYQQLTKSLELWRSVGDPRGLVFCMLYLGTTAFIQNNFSFITSILLECNEIAARNMDHWAQAFGLDMLGVVALAQGQNEEALDYFNQSIMHSNEIGDQLSSTQSKVHIGQAFAALGFTEEAMHQYRDTYMVAQQAKWTLTILSILVSFAEMNNISPETKLALVLVIISHPTVSPHLRARSEKMRDELVLTLTSEQIKNSKRLAKEKNLEDLARELLG